MNKILIIGPSWVGDMVMAQALFITLKQRYPNITIDVLAPEWSRPLLDRMPEINQSINLPFGHGELQLKQRYQLGKKLRSTHYDQAIILPNSLKSALIPFWANIPIRTGWRGEMRYGLLNDIRLLNKQQLPKMVQRFIALADNSNQLPVLVEPILQANLNNQQSLQQRLNLSTNQPILALCPGAEFGPAKRWPTNNFATIAQKKINQGWQVWILGSDKDKSIADNIKNNIDTEQQTQCLNLCGTTSLGDVVDLLALTHLVITNDSGLMHIAAAMNKQMVVIYGSSSPEFTPPLSAKATTISLELSCSPCFQRECPLGHLNCLHQLTPEHVVKILDKTQQLAAHNIQ